MTPEEIIRTVLSEMTYDSVPRLNLIHTPNETWEPDLEWNWAQELVLSRIEEMDLRPTEEELYTLMKLRMKG